MKKVCIFAVLALFTCVIAQGQEIDFNMEAWAIGETRYTHGPVDPTFYEWIDGDLLAVGFVEVARAEPITIVHTGIEATVLSGEIVHIATGERTYGAVMIYLIDGDELYTVSPLVAKDKKELAAIGTKEIVAVVTGTEYDLTIEHDGIGGGECEHCDQDLITAEYDCGIDYNWCAGAAAAAYVLCIGGCPPCAGACTAALVAAEGLCLGLLDTCLGRADRDWRTCVDRCCDDIGTSCNPIVDIPI